jgi:DNA-binding transcriptional ArsR family regulator
MVRVFKALACATRFSILEVLAGERLCVGAIAKRTGISQPSASQHLRVLRDAGLVTDHRCGYHIHYMVNGELIDLLRNSLPRFSDPGCPGPCSGKEETCAEANVNTPKN